MQTRTKVVGGAVALTLAAVTGYMVSTTSSDSWGQEIMHSGFEAKTAVLPRITLPDGTRRELLPKTVITYGVYPQPKRLNVDVRDLNNMIGYNNATKPAPPEPWPGVGGASPVIGGFPCGAYIAGKFTTTANVAALSGHFSNPSYVNGPALTMAISRLPGDFSEGLPTPGCLVRNVATSDANLVGWKGTPNAPNSWCNLQPLTDYYANIVVADTGECAKPQTVVGVVSYHN